MTVEKIYKKRDRFRRSMEGKIPARAARLMDQTIDADEVENLLVFDTDEELLLPGYNPALDLEEGPDCIVNLKRLNDIRYINKFLESVNENLKTGGVFVGRVETLQRRKQKLMKRFGWPFNKIYYAFDYLINRVWPKLPRLKRLYFGLTKGRNRVLSDMECFGRLYCCGFHLKGYTEAGGMLYFVAEKVAEPTYNRDVTDGPLIHLMRYGKHGKLIKVYKIRTMYAYSEYLQEYMFQQNGLQDGGKIKNDPRVTTVGRFFRKCFIDEIPQLYNLVKGEVKIFGVRPITKHYMSLFPEEFQEYRKKFKPGLIPPVYAQKPKGLDDVVAVERRYLEAYERYGILADMWYTCWALFNIFFKKVRTY
jgi:lipopolysaccharide/colanic/teichoic acid biosynthesis glycosyltransferase